jgi:hypothetical protein
MDHNRLKVAEDFIFPLCKFLDDFEINTDNYTKEEVPVNNLEQQQGSQPNLMNHMETLLSKNRLNIKDHQMMS